MKEDSNRADKAALTRRGFVKAGLGATGLAVAGPAMFPMPAIAADATIKVGFISPLTGPLASFGESDPFILKGMRKALEEVLKVNIVVPVFDPQLTGALGAAAFAESLGARDAKREAEAVAVAAQ